MTFARSFDPILGDRPRALVVGSMPGERSIAEGRYYGHPRNAFWWIMRELFFPGRELSYDERASALIANGVCVWDVLAKCVRKGSLDSAIVKSSEQPNAIPALLAENPSIGAVFFNGGKAEEAWRRHVAEAIPEDRALTLTRLPSTSPAHASLTRARKLEAWRALSRATGSPGR